MRLTLALVLATVSASTVYASGGGGGCPAIWNTISAQLTEVFVDPTTGYVFLPFPLPLPFIYLTVILILILIQTMY